MYVTVTCQHILSKTGFLLCLQFSFEAQLGPVFAGIGITLHSSTRKQVNNTVHREYRSGGGNLSLSPKIPGICL